MLLGPDGHPLRREEIEERGQPVRVVLDGASHPELKPSLRTSRSKFWVVSLSLGYLLAQTNFWHSGGTVVWEPNYDGTVKRVVWASPDFDEPVPGWVHELPIFTLTTAF